METILDCGKAGIPSSGTSPLQNEIAGELLALTQRMATLERDYHDAVKIGDTKNIESILESKRGGYRQIWKLRKEAGQENERLKLSPSPLTVHARWILFAHSNFRNWAFWRQ